MKIEMAVYTAQEGYSWQPGTALPQQALREFKERIGKFPSPDAEDFPFGGIFLMRDSVVFYRYHVAKKIDFRGRDALYCALGVVPKDKASEVDPAALFSLPQFAALMQPFPVSAEIAEADASAVPEWLKNLDQMTLDVKVSANSDGGFSYDVKQEKVLSPLPKPAEETKSAEPPKKTSVSDRSETKRTLPHAASADAETAKAKPAEATPAKRRLSKLELYLLILVVVGTFVIIALLGVVYVLEKKCRDAEKCKTEDAAKIEKVEEKKSESPSPEQVQDAPTMTNKADKVKK